MRRAVTVVATACLLIGPTALAFFSGGYFAQPRLVAGIVAWSLVLVLALAGPAPLPRGRPGALALCGLVLLTAWSALSVTWAPVAGPAVENVERLVLYVGALVVAVGVLRERAARRAVEPALAAGAAIVIGYGLAGRLLPGIVELASSRRADGRLEQPITYWNAEGALAAVGFVLCARLAADRSRHVAVRASAAAASPALAAGVYLTYSRGALAVAVLGLVILVAAVPSAAQVRAAAVALATGVAAAATSAAFAGVASLEGSHRTRDGAVVLAALVVLGLAAAAISLRPARDRPRGRRLAPVAAGAAAAVAVGLVAGGLAERPSAAELSAGAQASRLTTASSNRYEYWRVGIRAFGNDPLRGLGSGGFRVFWLQERPIPEAVRDAHSLEVETAAELGVPGLAALALLVGGVAVATGRALRRDPAAAAGPCAALTAWFLHTSIDWDWQLPAVTLPAIVLAGALVAMGGRPPPFTEEAR